MSQDDLVDTLSEIIGATASCDVELHGRVEPGRECTGTVELDGRELRCGDADGYVLKDDRRTLQLRVDLQGASNAKLTATFPCASVTPD